MATKPVEGREPCGHCQGWGSWARYDDIPENKDPYVVFDNIKRIKCRACRGTGKTRAPMVMSGGRAEARSKARPPEGEVS